MQACIIAHLACGSFRAFTLQACNLDSFWSESFFSQRPYEHSWVLYSHSQFEVLLQTSCLTEARAMQCRDLWYRRWKPRRLAGFERGELFWFSILTELFFLEWALCRLGQNATHWLQKSFQSPCQGFMMFYWYMIDTPLAHQKIVFAFCGKQDRLIWMLGIWIVQTERSRRNCTASQSLAYLCYSKYWGKYLHL